MRRHLQKHTGEQTADKTEKSGIVPLSLTGVGENRGPRQIAFSLFCWSGAGFCLPEKTYLRISEKHWWCGVVCSANIGREKSSVTKLKVGPDGWTKKVDEACTHGKAKARNVHTVRKHQGS